MKLVELANDNKSEITHIYHLSDIHIRNTQRHIEYKQVFERTYNLGTYNLGTYIFISFFASQKRKLT